MPFSRFTLVLVLASCALLSAAGSTTASSGGLKVLVTGNCNGYRDDLASAIRSQPGIASATAFDTSAATPTAAQLAALDLVVDLGDTCPGYDNAATYGDRLANYLDHGGVVLQAAYDNWNSTDAAAPTGRFASGGYPPLDLGPADNTATMLGQILKPNSPILKGLGTFATGDNTTTPLAAGATLLAKWADGRNAIAVKGRVVATSASADDSATLPDLARLARNTGRYFNAVPSTKITKAIINAKKRTAAFSFQAIGYLSGFDFECGLAKAGSTGKLKPCGAHKTYRNLQPGTYTFAVAAIGPGGVDPTPAKKTFKVGS